MGMELRIREPRADGAAPSRLGAAPCGGLLSPEFDCRAGVSRTSLRNCVLFIVKLRGGCSELEAEEVSMKLPSFSLAKNFSARSEDYSMYRDRVLNHLNL